MPKAKRVDNWGEIAPQVFTAFQKAVEKLREEMIPRDGDGDSPVEVLIVNRMTHQPVTQVPVPRQEIYSYVTHGYLELHPDKQRALEYETERALSFNVHSAAESLEQYMRTKHYNHEYNVKQQESLPESVYCKNGTCRARLLEFESYRGAGDQGTCPNNWCPSNRKRKR